MKDGIFLSREVLKQALQFAEKNAGCRTALNGIWVNVSDKSKPIIETTDGHRLHRIATDDSATSPDSDKLVNAQLEKKLPTVFLNAAEVNDIIFKIKEIIAVLKVHGFRNDGSTCIVMKFTKQCILFMSWNNVLTRYIRPKGGIQKELIGMTVGVNFKYLLEAFEVFDGYAVKMNVEDGLSPVVIRRDKADYPMHLLMPMRIHEVL